MFKKFQLYTFIFDLMINTDGVIVGSTFNVEGKTKGQFAEDELRLGHILQQEVFDGKYDWLIKDKPDMITLPTHNIRVTVTDPIYDGSVKYGGGSIDSHLKLVCEHCGDSNCNWDCEDALEHMFDRDIDMQKIKNEELERNRYYNFAYEAILSMVLGHAVAGIHIESAAYLEGLEAAINSVQKPVAKKF